MKSQADQILAKQLLHGETLSVSDASRLALEAIERLGEIAVGKNRYEMLQLMRQVIKEGVDSILASNHTVTLEEAAWSSVEARSELRASTRRDLRHFVRRILRVEKVKELPLRKIDTKQCRHILQVAFGNSKSSYQKGRVILHGIFSHGIRREWCDANPVSRIEVPSIKEKSITPLSVQETEKLQYTCEQRSHQPMRFSLHLMLYCGIRPTEVKRLKPKDISWEDQLVIIRPTTSKTGGGRIVPLRIGNKLRPEECIIPRNWQRRWHDLRCAAGFRQWVPDVCRHTFASYHAAYFRDLPALQLEMGHRDCSLLRSRYMVPTLRQEAARFWGNKTLHVRDESGSAHLPPALRRLPSREESPHGDSGQRH